MFLLDFDKFMTPYTGPEVGYEKLFFVGFDFC